MATSDPIQVDSVTGQTTTGHEWDGIQRTQHAAAALVAVDSSTSASCSRSATGSSIPRGRGSPASVTACWASPRAATSPPTSRRSRRSAPTRRRASRRRASPRSTPTRSCWRSRWRTARRRSPTTARPVTARAARVRQGLPNLTTDRLAVGRHAGRRSSRPSPTASATDADKDTRTERDARLRQGRHPEARPDPSGRQLRAHAFGLAPEDGRRRRRRQADLRRQLRRSATATTARVTSRWARPTSPTGLQLYGSDFKDLTRPSPMPATARCRPGARASIR